MQTNPTSSRWQKLLGYYGSCISVENTGNIILHSSKEGTDFLQVRAMEQEWVVSGKEKLEFEERKRIAEKVLESWKEERSRGENLKMILGVFAKILPEEVSFSKDILSGKTTELNVETGILPVGVIFKSTGSQYTRGLEQELGELRKSAVPNDVWRVILDRKDKVKEGKDVGLIEVTGLNNEQRGAVKSAFNNTVTVVTGPPGSGKSQIILNIIANALLHNETVLFGSKNRQGG